MSVTIQIRDTFAGLIDKNAKINKMLLAQLLQDQAHKTHFPKVDRLSLHSFYSNLLFLIRCSENEKLTRQQFGDFAIQRLPKSPNYLIQ